MEQLLKWLIILIGIFASLWVLTIILEFISKRQERKIKKEANEFMQHFRAEQQRKREEVRPRIMVNNPCHHCGQDAAKPDVTYDSLQDLVKHEVIAVHGPGYKCVGCPHDHYGTPCVKVELVGGYCLCLAPKTYTITTEE